MLFFKKKTEYFNLIVDNIESKTALDPFRKLISKIDSCLVITRSKYFCKNELIRSKNSKCVKLFI